jgi:predicted AAA+ superfamily ATPase
MNIKRRLILSTLLEKKSFFLFGPRSTGKSTMIREQLGERCHLIDLLDGQTFLRLSNDPSLLEEVTAQPIRDGKVIAIDEIQKAPALLDQVHRMIERNHAKFLLTGSSARKLRAGAANLLAGRAWEAQLLPLTFDEIKDLDLDRYLRFGGLPHVWLSDDPVEELSAYVHTYLREEIQAEGLIRKIPQFTRFLKVAALTNAKLLNFSEIASDTGIPASTIREYYSILADTLVGFLVEPWQGSKKRKAVQTAKFYLFDTGVTHTLADTKVLDRNSNLWGDSFEHFVGMELRAYISYLRIKTNLKFWRSVSGHEVDFIVDETLAVEVKATQKVSKGNLKGLKILAEEKKFKHLVCVSTDKLDRESDGIQILHWKTFLTRLWRGDFS